MTESKLSDFQQSTIVDFFGIYEEEEVQVKKVQDVQIEDWILGFEVGGISKGQHNGVQARTFQLMNPEVPEMEVGRLT